LEFRENFRAQVYARGGKEANTMKKWLYPLLVAFVAFVIFTSPSRAGAQARTFVIWLGDLAAAAGEFLDGLFTDESETVDVDVEIIQPGTGDSGGAVSGGGTSGETPSGGDGSDDFGLRETPLRV
jgi:hypothetical protein